MLNIYSLWIMNWMKYFLTIMIYFGTVRKFFTYWILYLEDRRQIRSIQYCNCNITFSGLLSMRCIQKWKGLKGREDCHVTFFLKTCPPHMTRDQEHAWLTCQRLVIACSFVVGGISFSRCQYPGNLTDTEKKCPVYLLQQRHPPT